ncbi:CRISPR-associated endonuclease Cas1 [Marine Group I thaumarchaeote]|uniref:CRISPR-associated endonuclease Cas1 n=1 Tax=Marine Group I thaumarchaeote TaxID=2511932 RepID=A0A7K4MLQ0_9ARCH|nr:CRISPR-associated endonuclease Cas1 [Marine Group I thaumarchaeote]
MSVKNSKVILKDCHDPFSDCSTEEWFVKHMPYDRIVLQGKGYISTEGLSLLSENNKTVILLDTFGNQITICHGIRDSYTATKYRIAQYDTFRDKTKTDYLSRQITRGKLESQIKFLKSTNNSEIAQGIEKLSRKGISEAVSSRYYFDNYSKLIDDRFQFTKRNSIQIQKYNTTDVINGLLNYGIEEALIVNCMKLTYLDRINCIRI